MQEDTIPEDLGEAMKTEDLTVKEVKQNKRLDNLLVDAAAKGAKNKDKKDKKVDKFTPAGKLKEDDPTAIAEDHLLHVVILGPEFVTDEKADGKEMVYMDGQLWGMRK